MEGLISFLSYSHFAKGKSTIDTKLYTKVVIVTGTK